MKQSPSSKAYSCISGQEIIMEMEVHYRFHNSLPLDPFLNHLTLVHIPTYVSASQIY